MKKILLFAAILMIGVAHAQIFQEDFEGGTFPPDGWTVESTNTTQTWALYTDGPITGTGSANVQYDENMVPQDEKLISPEIDLSAYSNVALTFKASLSYYWAVDPNDNYDFNVLASTDQGGTWTSVWNEDDHGEFPNFSAFDVLVNLDAYAGESSVQLAFHYTGLDGAQLLIDDILVVEAPSEAPACATLLSPANESTDVAAGEVTLSWEAVDGATGYDIMLGTSLMEMNNLGTTTETSVDLTGVQHGTTYYWSIAPKNLAGAAEGCETFSFTTEASPFAPYCGPLDISFSVEPITYVSFAGIENTTAADSSVGHESFLDQIGEVTQGETYSITLKGNTAGNYTNSFAVFIDWNQDGTFDETETYEILQTIQNSTGTDDIQAVQDLAVPADALLGETRMRVKKIFGTANLLDPCAGASFGQAEDYTINVSEALSTRDVSVARLGVYPNPAKSTLNISGVDAKEVKVFNALGQQMKVHSVDNKVNVENLAPGAYVLQTVDQKGNVKSTKFIKK